MIEINLLPGSGKKARRAAAVPVAQPRRRSSASAEGRGPRSVHARRHRQRRRRDARDGRPLHVHADRASRAPRRSAAEGACRTRRATRRCSRERETAEAKRDTVLRSAEHHPRIDDDRFIWPHIMDEVSRALPPYTWLVSLGFSGVGQATSPITTVVEPEPAAAAGRRRKAAPTQVVRDTVRIRLVGNTVDIQALTRFMKQLEASPFLENVQLDELRACDRQRQGSHAVPARHALRPPRCHRRASRAPRGLGEVIPWPLP